MNHIEEVLAHDEASRSSHKRLILQVWERLGLCLDDDQIAAFYKMPSPETITRTCRKFQEEGKYLGKKQNEMKFKSLQIQQRMPQTKAEDVPQLFEVSTPRYWG